MRTTLCSSLTRCITFALAVLAMGIMARPASAQGNCLQDEYNLVTKQKLNCTANDVRVAKVINIRNLDGTSRFTCTGGETFSFVADFLVQTTSSQARSNIGLYFATSDITNQVDALTGSCADNIISPPHKASDTSIAACFGSGADLPGASCTGFGTYEELDTGTKQSPGEPSSCNVAPTGQTCTDLPTGCGDTTSNDATICLSAPDTHGEQSVVACTNAQKRTCTAANNCFAGTQVVTVEIPSFTCPQAAAGTEVTAGDCTSWQEPGGAIRCIANPQDYMYPFNGPPVPPSTLGTPTAIPGSPSKCNCEQITLPLIVQTPNFIVQKACTTPTGTPGPATFNPTATPPTQSPTTCDAGPEGNFQLVTYTINIHNSSTGTGGVTVQQICDTEFGTIYRSGTYAGSNCSAGAGFLGTGSISCPSTGSLDIPFGGNVQCTFTSTPSVENLGVGTNASLSDTVSAVAVGDVSHTTIGPFSSNTVDVNTEDAPTSATTTPSPNALAQVCARETFHATVANTSGADEIIFISALHDSAPNDLTTASAAGPIVGTTCGVPTGSGLGTLSSSPAVPFPSGGIAPSGNYQCDFDVFFCAVPTTVEAYGTGHCSGTAINPGTCQTGGPTGPCTTNAQCDTTCTGISRSETLNATLAGDDAAAVAADVISPITNHVGNVSVCVQTDTSIN